MTHEQLHRLAVMAEYLADSGEIDRESAHFAERVRDAEERAQERERERAIRRRLTREMAERPRC